MEIINQLEADCRGAYTGSIGFIDDSIAEMELKETRNKALGLLKALKS